VARNRYAHLLEDPDLKRWYENNSSIAYYRGLIPPESRPAWTPGWALGGQASGLTLLSFDRGFWGLASRLDLSGASGATDFLAAGPLGFLLHSAPLGGQAYWVSTSRAVHWTGVGAVSCLVSGIIGDPFLDFVILFRVEVFVSQKRSLLRSLGSYVRVV
jgi:hypothetical protein